mmetsp:Transcript_655/g.1972  ORF Transcript_655/g.1972 Transcript_655/m.1972 type:complete len:253 (+) Transcript_655:190-948(+)
MASAKTAALERVGPWALTSIARFLAWHEAAVLRGRLATRIAPVLAAADDSEVWCRTRALALFARWILRFAVTVHPSNVHAMRTAFCQILETAATPRALRCVAVPGHARRNGLHINHNLQGILPSLRTGTQPPSSSSVPPWAFLDGVLASDVCALCLRTEKQRLRRADVPCSRCDMMPWDQALKTYRLTPEQLKRGPVVRRRRDNRWVGVVVVQRRFAVEASRRVWGDPRNAARAKRRAEKKKRSKARAATRG